MYILCTALFSQTRHTHSYKPHLPMWTEMAFSVLPAVKLKQKLTITSIVSAEDKSEDIKCLELCHSEKSLS